LRVKNTNTKIAAKVLNIFCPTVTNIGDVTVTNFSDTAVAKISDTLVTKIGETTHCPHTVPLQKF
jgi:hypothetical protein